MHWVRWMRWMFGLDDLDVFDVLVSFGVQSVSRQTPIYFISVTMNRGHFYP